MNKCFNQVYVRIKSGFYFLLALALLVIPLQWLFAWICAAAIHELGHIVSILCSGHRIERVEVGWEGARIFTDHLGRSEWICALSGPVLGLIILPLIRIFPRLSICALIQSAFNLLPIYPLDGGRVLKGVMLFFLEEVRAERIAHYISIAVICILSYVFWKYVDNEYSFLIILIVVFVVMKAALINIPCKRCWKWVQ